MPREMDGSRAAAPRSTAPRRADLAESERPCDRSLLRTYRGSGSRTGDIAIGRGCDARRRMPVVMVAARSLRDDEHDPVPVGMGRAPWRVALRSKERTKRMIGNENPT